MAAPPTHIGSGIRTGDVSNKNKPLFGAFVSPWYTYTAVPTTSTASSVANFAVVSGGNWTVAAGPNASTVTIAGQSYVDLGMARVVTATGSGASSAAVNITVSGREEIVGLDGTLTAGAILTETFSGPSGTATTATLKTFRYVSVVSTDGNTVSAVGIGHGDTVGFPYKAPYFGSLHLNYNNAVVTASTGYTAPDETTPATATTGDVRGTYALQVAANGSRRLVASIWINDPNTLSSLYGAPQFAS